jgi:hypothetical protein
MAYQRIKTEHAGPKNGGGAWMTRTEAKQTAKRKRRRVEKQETEVDQTVDEWGDLDEFSARGSEPTLRRLDEDGAASGIPGRKRR